MIYSDYDGFMDEKRIEWEMGFVNKFKIVRQGANWVCKYGQACSRLRADKPGIWIHANANHVIPEIKEKLRVLGEYSQDIQKQELKQYNMDQLEILLAQVEHHSSLEYQILLARDYLDNE